MGDPFVLRKYENGKDPIGFDLAVSKVLWTLTNPNPRLCHYAVNSKYVMETVQADEDAVLFLAIDKKSSKTKVQNVFVILKDAREAKPMTKAKPKIIKDFRKTVDVQWHPLEGFASGTVIEWEEKQKGKKGKKQKKRAFELEVLCAAVARSGIGRKLLKAVEKHVKQLRPKISELLVQSVQRPDTLKFYEANGFKPYYKDTPKTGEIWLTKTL